LKFFVTDKKLKAIVKIQATEGQKSELEMDSFLTGTAVNGKDDGCDNKYKTYGTQTTAIFQKYQGKASLGNWQTRALVDTRTAFISGEGLSVHASDNKLSVWIEKFLLFNKLKGSRFFDFVKAGEMTGKGLFVLTPVKEKQQVIIKRIPTEYEGGKKMVASPYDISDPNTRVDIKLDDKDLDEKNFEYVKLAGLPCEYNETTTKIGLALNHCDNYDRGMNAMRKNNHLFGKITPFFECQDDATVAKIAKIIKNGWQIGNAIAAKAKMFMVVPELGAMDNIKAEQLTLAKAISFLTGIPVHWLGHVDAMSNRSTAETLYETINNGTVNERSIWSESFYEIILKAQEIAINAGFKDAPKTVNADFEVTIPLVPFTRMLQYVQALSLAFNDGAISLADYTNMLPGVDPFRVKQNKEEEAAAEAKATETLINKTKLQNPEEDKDDGK